MTRYLYFSGAAATSILAGSAAFADVSAADVRDDMLAYMSSGQFQVDYTESGSDGSITLNDLTLTMPIPEEDIAASFTLPEISFIEQGDGTVAIVTPDVQTSKVMIGPAGEGFSADVMIAQSGVSIIASGSNEETTYTYSADTVSITNTNFMVEGESYNGTGAFNVSDASGEYTITTGELIETVGSENIGTFAMSANLDVPDEIMLNFSLSISDISSQYAMASIPGGLNYEDPMAMVQAIQSGLAILAAVETGQTAMNFEFEERSENASFQMTSSGAQVGVNFNKDVAALSESFDDLMVVASGSEIPLPQFLLQAAQISFGFEAPLSASDDPRDIIAELGVVDLAIQPEIWGMLDPMNVLPRDPLTAVVDLSGKGNLFYDMITPDGMMAMDSGNMPGAIHEVTLEELTLRGAGAEATGSGSFTFDNSDMNTIPGMPRPEGSVTFNVSGANGLLDNLIAMGLIPEDEAMGMRMMMGMFAVPTEGDDALTSTIEVNAEGHILANGQRIQ